MDLGFLSGKSWVLKYQITLRDAFLNQENAIVSYIRSEKVCYKQQNLNRLDDWHRGGIPGNKGKKPGENCDR